MPITILAASLLSHTEDHAAGTITARIAYTFNTGAVEDKIHSGIPIPAVDAYAATQGRTRTAADVCEIVRAALGENAADLVFTIATPPQPNVNA